MTAAIEVEGLAKTYPNGTRAVDGISFSVQQGEIFGFLGPNGAGKTTTIRILVTLLPPTAGVARVGGADVAREGPRVRQLIGYAAQFIGIDDELTVRENMELQGRLHGLAKPATDRRVSELVEVFALADVVNNRSGALSGGMRRRLDLAQALVHRPAVLFLDEPTTGLDPQSRSALWEQLESLSREGSTVFLTTQYIEEADHLCHNVAVIDHGRIVVAGAPEPLKQQLGREVISITLSDEAGDSEVGRAIDAARRMPGVRDVLAVGRTVTLQVPQAGRLLSDLVRRLDEAEVVIDSVALSRPTLQDVFLRYTGERVRSEEAKAMPASAMAQALTGKGRRA